MSSVPSVLPVCTSVLSVCFLPHRLEGGLTCGRFYIVDAVDRLLIFRWINMVLLVGGGLLVMFIIPSAVFCAIEEWNIIDSVYFCFITLSTIGLGDYVAGGYMYMTIYCRMPARQGLQQTRPGLRAAKRH